MQSKQSQQPSTSKSKKVNLKELKDRLTGLESLLEELNAPRSIIANVRDVDKTIMWLEKYVSKH